MSDEVKARSEVMRQVARLEREERQPKIPHCPRCLKVMATDSDFSGRRPAVTGYRCYSCKLTQPAIPQVGVTR